MKLYRAMKVAADGLPELGRSARQLSVRTPSEVTSGVEPDVLVAGPTDAVKPGDGGLSVSPNSPMNLPPLRRPPEYPGGRGKDPVWVIEVTDLEGTGVQFRQDAPTHGLLEPVTDTTLTEYETALANTRALWKQVVADSETTT